MSSKKENWKPINKATTTTKVQYMISSHGRFGVKTDEGKVEARNLKPINGTFRYNARINGKSKALFLTREVAMAFLNKPSKKHVRVIHKDHDFLNNHIDNLKWVTISEHREHTLNNPKVVAKRKKRVITKSVHAQVLNEKSVSNLKKMIWDPKRKMSFKKLAEKFGVSEMQIYRIKSGEFWYHIKVDNEPVHPKYKQNLANFLKLEQSSKKSIKKKH